MVQSDLRTYLPPSTELPDSDVIPVDNKDQNLIPNVLLFLLNFIWIHRQDWCFGVDMGIYHSTGVHPQVPVVTDGFLLAIGRYQSTAGGIQQELFGRFDVQGKRYLMPEEKAECLAARPRELGEDPDQPQSYG